MAKRRHRENRDDARRAVESLLSKLASKRISTKIGAIRALSYYGQDALPAAAILVSLIKSDDGDLRSAAMHALADIAQASEDTVSSLRKTLQDRKINDDPYIACRIYWVLERIEKV